MKYSTAVITKRSSIDRPSGSDDNIPLRRQDKEYLNNYSQSNNINV